METNHKTLEKTLQKLKIFFLLTGLKLHDQTNPSKMLYLVHFVWLNTDTLMVVINAVTGISALELLFITPCLTFSLLGAVKAFFYTIRATDVHQLIDDLMKLDATRDSFNLEMAKEIKATEINLLHKAIKVFKWLSIVMMVVSNIGPLLLIIVTYYRTRQVKLVLPFLDVYPFDALKPIYWPFVYIHQSWSVCIVILYGSAVDCILFTCCTYLRIQFRLLQVDIENIIPTECISRRFSGDTLFQNKFTELLKTHQEIIRLLSNLENIFSKSILLNFMTSSLVICFTGFNVMIVEDITFVITFVIFLLMGLLQIWCLCYFGELLMSSSVDVSDAVYASKWYLASKDISKQLLTLQTRAQNPCKLTAYGFADVNLSAFMKIISKAWSYFALLNTIYAR